MATRSTVGYTKKDGTIVAVFCHYHGAPDSMVPNLERFIKLKGVRKFMAEVRRGQKQGGIRSLKPQGIETYKDVRGVVPEGDFTVTRCEIDEGEYQEYCYLVDPQTSEIVEYYNRDGQQTIETMRGSL